MGKHRPAGRDATDAERIGLGQVSLDDLEVLFGHDVPPDVWQAGAAHQRDQATKPFGENWPLDAWPTVQRGCWSDGTIACFPSNSAVAGEGAPGHCAR